MYDDYKFEKKSSTLNELYVNLLKKIKYSFVFYNWH